MNISEQRGIALGAARHLLRKAGYRDDQLIYEIDYMMALETLDDLFRSERTLVASVWYKNASETQEKLFGIEWRKWQRKTIREKHFIHQT